MYCYQLCPPELGIECGQKDQLKDGTFSSHFLTFSLSHPKILDGPFLPAQIRSLKGSRPGATGHPVRRHSDIGIQVFLFHVVNRHEMSPEKLTWHGDFLLNDAQVFVHAR